MSIFSGLANVFDSLLRPEGFRRRSRSWYRICGPVYAVVSLQESSFDDTCYVNIGFSLADRAVNGWLPEQKCQVRFRAEALREISPADTALLDPDSPVQMGEESWLAAATERLAAPVVRTVVGVVDLQILQGLLQFGVSNRVFVHREIRDAMDLIG